MPDEETVFKVGDVVSLNSGGQSMTVVSIDEGYVTSDWSVRGDVKSKSSPIEALKIADKLGASRWRVDMLRASWRGFLRLSLVSCPIYLYPATTRTKSIRLHQV
jgi:uncharacterized protein YodC (DUF2158 family)